jgi:hypothetical protein
MKNLGQRYNNLYTALIQIFHLFFYLFLKSVHQRMRNIRDEGIEWLEKENELARNILKSSGLMKKNLVQNSNIRSENEQQRGSSAAAANVDDLTRRKFEKFLGGSKK